MLVKGIVMTLTGHWTIQSLSLFPEVGQKLKRYARSKGYNVKSDLNPEYAN